MGVSKSPARCAVKYSVVLYWCVWIVRPSSRLNIVGTSCACAGQRAAEPVPCCVHALRKYLYVPLSSFPSARLTTPSSGFTDPAGMRGERPALRYW